MSDSVRPYGLQPTRLIHPWDFPGKSPGVGATAFSDEGEGRENSIDRIVHRVAKSWTRLSDFHFHFSLFKVKQLKHRTKGSSQAEIHSLQRDSRARCRSPGHAQLPACSKATCSKAAPAWGGASEGRTSCEVLQRRPAVAGGTAAHSHGAHLQEAWGGAVGPPRDGHLLLGCRQLPTTEERTALLDTSSPPLLVSDDCALPPLDESASLSVSPNQGKLGDLVGEEFIDTSLRMSPRAESCGR